MNDARLARWSRYLLFFILAVLPLERLPSLDLAGPVSVTIRLSQVAGLLLIALTLPVMWRQRRQLWRSPWRWLVGFWVVCLLSAGLSDQLGRALAVSAFTGFVGLLAWAIALRFERGRIQHYFTILIASALAACAFGFYQFFGDLLGLPTWATGLRDAYTKVVFGFPRIQSTGLEPLYFGDYLLIPSGMLIMAIILGYRRKFASWSLLVVATVIWLTVSRGAMVALGILLLAGLVAALVLTRVRAAGRILVISGLSIASAIGLLYVGANLDIGQTSHGGKQAIQNFSKQSTNVTNGESSEGRAITRELAVRAFLARPILGIGPGNFGAYANQQMPERFTVTTAIVNNEPLEILAETGILGLGALTAFLIALTVPVIRQTRHHKEIIVRVLAFGLVGALVAIAAQYQTFSTLYITHVWVAIGLLGGLLVTTLPRPRQPRD